MLEIPLNKDAGGVENICLETNHKESSCVPGLPDGEDLGPDAGWAELVGLRTDTKFETLNE